MTDTTQEGGMNATVEVAEFECVGDTVWATVARYGEQFVQTPALATKDVAATIARGWVEDIEAAYGCKVVRKGFE
jgi:hypothetical protein